ncbi:MAG: SPFH domain-containing protein [Lachnospiraceae bacterium]|nr:SPFH domain-containing protein [Lachnospiraceae bacterium]
MGLIKAALAAGSTVLADQWKEYFYCDSMDTDVLIVKGQKRTSSKSSNTKGSDNIISNGSVIAVNEGQCMIIVEQGAIVDLCAEAGEYTYDKSTEPSVFYGGLGQGVKDSFKTFGRRFTFGGDTGKDQRVYFVNTKDIIGNKYGTPEPVPFRIIDRNIDLDLETSVRCNGLYSFRIIDPVLLYKKIAGNVTDSYRKDQIEDQLKSELITALQPAFAQISAMGVRYSELPAHTKELTQAMHDELESSWGVEYGIEVAKVTINSATIPEEDQNRIKYLQTNKTASMAAANIAAAQADAMRGAANNSSAGPMMAFAGMNMASNAGGLNAAQLYSMGAQQQAQQAQAAQTGGAAAPAADTWECPNCHKVVSGKFCTECGSPRPAAEKGWECPNCHKINQGKFCQECGTKKPEGAPLYKCDKCGWEPEDPMHPPKFCPQCGDPFNDNDIQK